MEFVKYKTILSKEKYGSEWFGIDYKMNLYRDALTDVFTVIVEVIATI